MGRQVSARPDRLPGWQSRLSRYIDVAVPRCFEYGVWDCALFVAGAVEALTGQDVRPDWSYTSRAEGVRLMRAAGHRNHIDYFRSLFRPVAPAAAQPGDIAVMPGRSLGILQGRAVYLIGPGGMGLGLRSQMREALAV